MVMENRYFGHGKVMKFHFLGFVGALTIFNSPKADVVTMDKQTIVIYQLAFARAALSETSIVFFVSKKTDSKAFLNCFLHDEFIVAVC